MTPSEQNEFEAAEKIVIDGVLYYKDRYCLCKDRERIPVKSCHEYLGIPRFISGHNNKGVTKETNPNFACSKEKAEKISKTKKGKPQPKGFGAKISKARKGMTKEINPNLACSKEKAEKIGNALRGITKETNPNLCRSEESKKKSSKSHVGIKPSEESKEKNRKSHLGKKMPKGTGEKIRRSLLKLWQNPEFREKQCKIMLKGLELRPTKPEKFLIKLFLELFSNEYKYVGDSQCWIGGKNPDFMNIGSQKKLIEFFGYPWHDISHTKISNNIHEKRRINHFAKYGYQTLVIWWYELKDLEQLKKRLLQFHSG